MIRIFKHHIWPPDTYMLLTTPAYQTGVAHQHGHRTMGESFY